MCVLSIKVPIRKKSGNLFNDPYILDNFIVCFIKTQIFLFRILGKDFFLSVFWHVVLCMSGIAMQSQREDEKTFVCEKTRFAIQRLDSLEVVHICALVGRFFGGEIFMMLLWSKIESLVEGHCSYTCWHE